MPFDSDRPRTLLVGCGPTALSALDSLAEVTALVGLVRGFAADRDPVARRAAELGVDVTADTTVRAIERLVDRLRPDAVTVSSYDRILPAPLLAKSRFVNVHYSLLPLYRGRANVNWAVINGEAATGISIHVLAPDLDAGNILYQEALPIEPTDTVTVLYERLNALQRRHLGATVLKHLRGEPGRPQDEAAATYGCTRLRRDGQIDWNAPTRQIAGLVRSLAPPYPGSFTYLDAALLTIWRAEPVAAPPRYAGRIPGRIVRVSRPGGWVEVLTGDGVLRVHEVQTEEGGPRPAAQVLPSVKLTLGLHPLDLLDRIRRLEAAWAAVTRESEAPFAGACAAPRQGLPQ